MPADPVSAFRPAARTSRASARCRRLAQVIRATSPAHRTRPTRTRSQVIATSETYESKEAALKGIESVKTNAPGAEVDDQTAAS
jgi:uncharacterized protein